MFAQHPYFRITERDFAGTGRKFAKLASQTYTIGGLVSFQVGVGTVRPMQAADPMVGICDVSITSAHADYANTAPIDVIPIFRGDIVYCPVSTGTPALTQLGDEADVVAGGLSITLTESNNDFRLIQLDGVSTTSIYAVPMSTLVF